MDTQEIIARLEGALSPCQAGIGLSECLSIVVRNDSFCTMYGCES